MTKTQNTEKNCRFSWNKIIGLRMHGVA